MFARRFATALCFTVLVAGGAIAQQQEQKAPDMATMMKEFAKWSAPGDAHKNLEKLAGTWTTTQRMWMDPSGQPMESKGTAEFHMGLGGRFLMQSYKGDFMGMPFEGMGTVGYDNFKKVYTSAWADNMGTAMMIAEGTANTAGSEISLSGTMDEPMTGEKNKKFREVMKLQGPDQFTFEMYDTIPGKGEVKVMEIVHTRSK